MRLLDQFGRVVAGCHAEGRGFESLHPLHESPGRDLESPTLLRESVEPRAVDRVGWKDWRTLMRVYAKATKRRERLSGAHLRAYDRAIEWHEWAQTLDGVLHRIIYAAPKGHVDV
jgi:hypothetical protein